MKYKDLKFGCVFFGPPQYNPNKKRKILIVFYNMIADMLINKKLNPIVNELFIRSRKVNISLFLLHNHILLCQKILY